MYRRVEAQMILSGFSKKTLAEKIGMRYNTLFLKMNGTSKFTLDEALKIREVINATESVEVLFDNSVSQAS